MGPMCFDYGFGPLGGFVQGNQNDLDKTDEIACKVLKKLSKDATDDVKQQMLDNIKWIEAAKENNMVVGSKARILYANSRAEQIAKAF